MVKSYKTHSLLSGVKFSCINALKANKIKLLVSFALILIAFSAGIFVAVKSNNNYSLGRLQEINLENFYNGVAASSGAFLGRSLSLCVNVVLLVVFSLSPFMFPLACVLFAYRGYLLGLNFTLIFVFYGMGSIFSAVIIILPCQLLTIFVLVAFYCVLQRMNANCKRYGGAECNRALFVALMIVILLLLNLLETILLCLFSGRVILVI